jgi:hypothetical protein
MTAPEGDLDARLQRARTIDWRFALPDPAPTTVMTSGRVPRQVAEAMAEAGWQTATAEADLAVTFEPDDAALRAALTALRDDGTLCVMWRRRLGRFPRRGVASRSGTAADLRRRGLEVRWHVLVPNASATGAIVPLTTPQPLELLLRRRSGVTGSRAARWLAELLRRYGLLVRLAPAVLLVAHRRLAAGPRVGGAVTEPRIAAPRGSDAISRHLADLRLHDPGLPIPERHGPPLLLTPRFRASRHVVALVPQGDGRDQGPLRSEDPALVLKVARVADRGEVARREAAALERIAAGPERWRASAPALVHLGRPWDLPTLVETAVSGRPLDPAMVRRDPERAIAAVSGWLVSMVRSADTPESGAVPARDRIERLLDAPMTTFMAGWSGREEQPLIDATRAAGDTVRAARLPVAFEHGDASHPNLLRRSDGSLAAVDWECAEPEGLPLHDLTTFLAYVAVVRARTAARHDEGEVIASSLLAADGWAARALAEHSQRIGVESGCIRALVTISLARLTMGLAERLEDDRTLPPSAVTVDWLRGHRYHVAWRSVALATGPR